MACQMTPSHRCSLLGAAYMSINGATSHRTRLGSAPGCQQTGVCEQRDMCASPGGEIKTHGFGPAYQWDAKPPASTLHAGSREPCNACSTAMLASELLQRISRSTPATTDKATLGMVG